MPIVDILEAETNPFKLVEAVQSGTEVIIARYGRPVARLLPMALHHGQRIGVARGAFLVPDAIDAENPAVEALFSSPGA